jgi:paraquat-inducible protein B
MTELDDEIPAGRIRRPRFSIVWIIPIVAALIAGYLGYHTVMEEGPLLTIAFNNGEGLSAAQTQVKYKDVALGTVESIALSHNHKDVIVRVRMTSVGAPFMTSHARFWVVRPSFSAAGISGLDTLISGSYIAVDPGATDGSYQDSFVGLEAPPGVRSDEPGSTFILKADNIGSLGTGSPVFYRDVDVGEVLNYSIGNGIGPVTINIFVHAPYDSLVRQQSHFWNSSGLSVSLQGGTFHVAVQSLQALISGGVTFDLPPEAVDSPPSPDNSTFPLYPSQDVAASVGYSRKVPFVTYFESAVDGLVPGAPVNILGIQVGQVTDVKLILDPLSGTVKVRVAMELQPGRVFRDRIIPADKLGDAIQTMVNKGLRVELTTASYVTGQQVISLTMVPGAKPVPVTTEGDAFVLPSEPGAFGNIMVSLGKITDGLAKIPYGTIGDNLNTLLVTTNKTVSTAEINQTLTNLNQTLTTANATLGSVSKSYGNDSDFQRNLEQLMDQTDATLRSVDLLTSYLNRNPSALIRGRSGP